MIELYHNDMSVCAQKVRFALAEKKLACKSNLCAICQSTAIGFLRRDSSAV